MVVRAKKDEVVEVVSLLQALTDFQSGSMRRSSQAGSPSTRKAHTFIESPKSLFNDDSEYQPIAEW